MRKLLTVNFLITIFLLVGCCSLDQYSKTIVLDKVTIHLVDHVDYPTAQPGYEYWGYATSNNEIWVRSWKKDGKIEPDYCTLGHELTHLMNWKDDEVVNPDR